MREFIVICITAAMFFLGVIAGYDSASRNSNSCHQEHQQMSDYFRMHEQNKSLVNQGER